MFLIDIKEKMTKISLCWQNMLNWMLRSKKFMTSLIFMRWRHDQMRAIFRYTFSQLRYSAKLEPNRLALLAKIEIEICPFKALSRDTWWRHKVFKATRHNFCNRSMHLPSFTKIHICSMAKVVTTKSPCKSMGFFRKKKKKSEQEQQLFRCAAEKLKK